MDDNPHACCRVAANCLIGNFTVCTNASFCLSTVCIPLRGSVISHLSHTLTATLLIFRQIFIRISRYPHRTLNFCIPHCIHRIVTARRKTCSCAFYQGIRRHSCRQFMEEELRDKLTCACAARYDNRCADGIIRTRTSPHTGSMARNLE